MILIEVSNGSYDIIEEQDKKVTILGTYKTIKEAKLVKREMEKAYSEKSKCQETGENEKLY